MSWERKRRTESLSHDFTGLFQGRCARVVRISRGGYHTTRVWWVYTLLFPSFPLTQICVDVNQVANHFFENGIAHFTRRINKSISLACANGDVAPFVGHNAFLRWSAIQEVAFVDPEDGVKKIWSENNVSEDFDMALRLQVRGRS